MARVHPPFSFERLDPRSAKLLFSAILIITCSILSIGCNTMPHPAAPSSTTSSTSSATPNAVALEISPASPSVAPGGNVQFSATVKNTSETAVVWSASAGTISSTGLFTAPANSADDTITVVASSVASREAQARCHVSIHKQKLDIDTSNLPAAVIDTPYSASLTASGGRPPYRWTIATGSLPPGLQLDPDAGTLSGSPTRAGTFDFTVRGTDASAQSSQEPLSLEVLSRKACGPPAYCSRTDTKVVELPPAPPDVGNLTGANRVVTDPDFHNRIVRVTDALTNGYPRFINRTFMTATSGSADENLWNVDSTLFIVQDTGAQAYPFTFDPTTMRASRMYRSSFPQIGGLMMNSGIWSRVNPNLLYTYSGTEIDRYDFTDRKNPPSPERVYDFTSSPHCLPPGFRATWHTRGGVSADDTVFGMAYSNLGAQDSATYAVAYKTGKGCRVLDTETGRVWGDWGEQGVIRLPERWAIHNAKLSKDGNWLVLVVGNCLTPGCSGPFFWQIETTNVTSCSEGGYCDGHWTEGYTHWVNNNDSPITNQVIRPFAAPRSIANLTRSFPAKFSGFFDQHQSWNNVDPADSAPLLSSTWIPTTTFNAPWYDEIIGLASDGSGTTWRFAHSFITGRSQNFPTKYGIGSVSQDGRFFIFSSDWMGTLGSESGSKDCTIGTDCRGDVFVVELK